MTWMGAFDMMPVCPRMMRLMHSVHGVWACSKRTDEAGEPRVAAVPRAIDSMITRPVHTQHGALDGKVDYEGRAHGVCMWKSVPGWRCALRR